jgi:hypothetical protein
LVQKYKYLRSCCSRTPRESAHVDRDAASARHIKQKALQIISSDTGGKWLLLPDGGGTNGNKKSAKVGGSPPAASTRGGSVRKSASGGVSVVIDLAEGLSLDQAKALELQARGMMQGRNSKVAAGVDGRSCCGCCSPRQAEWWKTVGMKYIVVVLFLVTVAVLAIGIVEAKKQMDAPDMS